MEKKEHLLDALARKVGCLCLSDLRLPCHRKQLLDILERIPPEDYPAAEWWAAAFYLLDFAK